MKYLFYLFCFDYTCNKNFQGKKITAFKKNEFFYSTRYSDEYRMYWNLLKIEGYQFHMIFSKTHTIYKTFSDKFSRKDVLIWSPVYMASG